MEDWVKLHTRYYVDAKVDALPDADTELMFVRGLARAGEVARAGFIPAESLPKLARKRRYAASVDALLAAGLWTRVPGGYQVTNWDHWQDGLDALARRRAADRERQRRRRAAALESTSHSPPVDNSVDDSHGRATMRDKSTFTNGGDQKAQPLDQRKQDTSRDDGPRSRDVSRDVTVTEKEKEGVQVGDQRRGYARASPEPPSQCPQHLDDPSPPPCGPCADARRAHDRWETQRAARRAAAPKCRRHRGQPADNCALCRSERLAVQEETR